MGYGLLRRLGRLLYGKPADHSTVQKVPFGLYLKYQGDPDGFRNEFNALQLAHRYTSIPAPEPLDIVSRQDSKDFPSHEAYLLITEVPGIPLSQCHELLSDEDLECISKHMTKYISQLRKIPGPSNTAVSVCNTLGEECRDTRIRGAEPVGPFVNEDAFNQVLRFPDHPGRQGHSIVFTHADLNPRNILVGPVAQLDGRVRWDVTGIVDWENSGYFPEYWEFTKAMFEGFRWPMRYNKVVRTFFKEFGGYELELQVETMSWETGDAV
jgi:aminoglycoside phosphotransferase (APT) family kinase protein